MQATSRWQALDALRGLSVIGMLLNLNPGAWEQRFPWLDHAEWHGWTPIDMVFPAFLFCVGAALPLSLTARIQHGATRRELLLHVLSRSFALIVVGVLLNAYPSFEWAHTRLPGVLQRIGLCGGLVGGLLLVTSRLEPQQGVTIRPGVMAAVSVFVLMTYALLLGAVPVPGFGAPRFDSVGSWPAVVDRQVFGVAHLFPYGTTNGRVTYDPEGLLSTLPACVNVMAGVLTAHWIGQRRVGRPITVVCAAGVGLLALGVVTDGFCPIVKKLWTSSFVLISVGVSLLVLAGFSVTSRLRTAPAIFPLRVFGANALLAFVLCTLAIPLLDLAIVPAGSSTLSIRQSSYHALQATLPNAYASFAFSLLVVAVAFLVLWPLYRQRWFLRL